MIRDLILQPESKTLEFAYSLSSPRPWLKTLVAFANSAGGRLVFGVTDDRHIVGVDHPLDEEERIANLIADAIAPRLVAKSPEKGVRVVGEEGDGMRYEV